MTSAIKGQPNENNKARTYGAIFINYHPYYYRGVANLNLGRYQQAIDDLERTSGPDWTCLKPISKPIRRRLMNSARTRRARSSSSPTMAEIRRGCGRPAIRTGPRCFVASRRCPGSAR